MLSYLLAAVKGLTQWVVPPPKPPRVTSFRLEVDPFYFEPWLYGYDPHECRHVDILWNKP